MPEGTVQAVARPLAPRITPVRLLIALASVGVALWLTLQLRGWIPQTQFVIFYAAVLLSAVLGGVRLAAVALVASLGALELFLYGTAGAVDFSSAFVFRNVTLALVSLTGAYLIERQRTQRELAERKTREAEDLAAQLSEQSSQLEMQVTDSEALAAELDAAHRQTREQAEAALRAGERTERLQRLTSLLLESVGEGAVARVITHEARDAVEAAGAVVAVRREGQLVEVASEGLVAGAPDGGGSPLRLLEAASSSGEPVWVADAAGDSAGSGGREVGAWCALPLIVDRRQLGVMAFSFAAAGDFPPEDRSFLLLLAQQCAQALERARLHETSLRARVRAEFAERRLSLLAEASARLSASLEYEATLRSLADLVVPDLADWCVVHLQEPQDSPRLVAVAHADASRAEARRQAEVGARSRGVSMAGYEAVVVDGAPSHVATVTDDMLEAAAADDAQLDMLRSLQLRSQLTVPILGETVTWGALVLTAAESGRTFSEADVRLAVELGRRAGQAVDNARLYQSAHFASEAKSNFLAVMSHELRTPLNAIIGYSDLLLLGVPSEIPDRARRQIERIRSASDSLLHLVEEVLSFSRIEAGKEEIRISPLNLSGLLADATAMIEPMAAEKKLELEVRLPDHPLKLVSDERKIRQIVTNLLSNAVKFTEQGGIRVEAGCDDDSLYVAIHDTGIGIPEEHLERIFDPFWQVEQSSTRRFGGTGLGLGVARKLAKLLEGRLEVSSEEGKGSVFTLTLPRQMPGMGRNP